MDDIKCDVLTLGNFQCEYIVMGFILNNFEFLGCWLLFYKIYMWFYTFTDVIKGFTLIKITSIANIEWIVYKL